MSVDLYERCVAEVLGIPSEEVTTAQRMAAKGACFAVRYRFTPVDQPRSEEDVFKECCGVLRLLNPEVLKMKTKNIVQNTTAMANAHPLATLLTSQDGGIEASEARGQRELVESEVLPKDCAGLRNRPVLEAWGIQICDPVEDDDLFIHVKLPEGWKKEASTHSMWSNLVDDKGRVRAAVFYKAAFYDRKAHINVCTRYRVEVEYEPEPGKRRRGRVLDGSKVIFATDWMDDTAVYPADNARDPATTWLNDNKPGWEDPTKHWDEA